MNRKINVSLEEIRNFQDCLRHLSDDIDYNINVLYDIFGNVSDRLQKAIHDLENSKINIDNDLIVLDILYKANEDDIDKRQAKADQAAQTQGTSAPRIDRSVLNSIDNERRSLNRLLSQTMNNISTYNSALSTITSAYESVVKTLNSANQAINELLGRVSRAYNYVDEATKALSLGDNCYYGGLFITDIGVLLEGSSRLTDYEQRMRGSSSDVYSAVEDFYEMLDDDVSRASREEVSDISAQISNLARFYRTAAESLCSGYSFLKSYLSLA